MCVSHHVWGHIPPFEPLSSTLIPRFTTRLKRLPQAPTASHPLFEITADQPIPGFSPVARELGQHQLHLVQLT
jgi:hypothetical protein